MENPEIVRLTMEHSDAVFEYMKTEFCPDEPLFRATDIMNGNGFMDKFAHKEIRKHYFDKGLQSGDCFGSFDADGNLLGLRLGFISNKQNLPWDPSLSWMLNLPSFLMSKKFKQVLHALKFQEETDYKMIKAFDQCEGNNGKIYFGLAVGVARKGRCQGLGGKLLKKSIDHAKEQGCSHMYLLATGKYSQKIMKNHGFEIIKEKNYESYKDKDGNIVIKDEVHTCAQTVALKIE